MEKWKNKLAVVTGANHGNGFAIMKKLAENGVSVIGLDIDIENLKELQRKMSPDYELFEKSNCNGKNFIAYIKCDLTKSEEVEKTFEEIAKIDSIQILINNAGIFRDIGILDYTKSTSQLEHVIDLNLTAIIRCSRLAYKTMKPHDFGYIININSIHGHSIAQFDNGVQLGVYPASKYGVTAATEIMRRELVNAGNRKIRVTSLSPGLVKTNILKAAGLAEDVVKSFLENPYIYPEDIADTVLYLLSTPEHVNVSEITVRPTGGNV